MVVQSSWRVRPTLDVPRCRASLAQRRGQEPARIEHDGCRHAPRRARRRRRCRYSGHSVATTSALAPRAAASASGASTHGRSQDRRAARATAGSCAATAAPCDAQPPAQLDRARSPQRVGARLVGQAPDRHASCRASVAEHRRSARRRAQSRWASLLARTAASSGVGTARACRRAPSRNTTSRASVPPANAPPGDEIRPRPDPPLGLQAALDLLGVGADLLRTARRSR